MMGVAVHDILQAGALRMEKRETLGRGRARLFGYGKGVAGREG